MIPAEGHVAFDRYTVDLEARRLSSDGRSVALQEKPFRLLVALLERPGHVVKRQELYDALWPADVYVDRDAGLNTAVRKLRAALREVGNGAGELLLTVPRVGYRLGVDRPVAPIAAAGDRPPASRPVSRRVGLVWAAAGLALAATVAVLVLGGSRRPGEAEPMPRDAELRQRYIEARSLLGRVPGDLARARELLRSVVLEAPDFAPAHAYLAEASGRHAMSSTEPAEAVAEARRGATRAIEIDPSSAVGHRALAMIALNFDWDLASAGELLARALALDPADPINHLAFAAYSSVLGRHEEAISAARRAVELDPDSMTLRSDAGYFLIRAGRFDEAARECEMVLRIDRDNIFGRTCLLAALAASGEVEAARSHAVALLRLGGAPEAVVDAARSAADPRRVYARWDLERLLERPQRRAVWIARHYLTLGDRRAALSWLEQAARKREPLLIFVPQNPAFDQVRDDARYREILADAGLAALAPRSEPTRRAAEGTGGPTAVAPAPS